MLALVRRGLLSVVSDFSAYQARLEVLAKRYADRSADLADLHLICFSERFPSLPVITVDSAFKIYRRHQREMIPVWMPTITRG